MLPSIWSPPTESVAAPGAPAEAAFPQRGLDYGPQHVPAFLPLKWAERHLGAFTAGISMPVLRRTSAVFLVRRALVGASSTLPSSSDSASPDRAWGPPSHGGPAANEPPDAYDRALDAITEDLTSAPMIDYRHRRERLADWAMPPDAWRKITDRIERQPSPRYISENRARLAVTAYIWTQVTNVEIQFAPQPSESRSNPELNMAWNQDRFSIGQWLRQNEVPLYQQMRPLSLDTLVGTSEARRAGRSGRWDTLVGTKWSSFLQPTAS
ncbi:hypothetical protein ACIP79_19875 [Streptomyces sp. NPDC088747]|uniref:hypothetical protein n=1 Tax=Streptomyces sp. NPDC088747 TaxID=3365886 RepID=UPI00382CC365